MDNVNNVEKSNNTELTTKFIQLKQYEGINESNLMTIPFVSFKKAKVPTLEKTWTRSNGETVGIKVVGSAESGCPTMAEMDVLLALFRIMIKNNGGGYNYDKLEKKVELTRVINFTYNELANELGYSDLNGNIKKRLERSIKTLNETTLYSSFGIRDASQGEYVDEFKGEESCRIISKYKSYSMTRVKRKGDKYASPSEVKEQTFVEIDSFFFDNMCNNYFKIYDFKKYISLTRSISKKLFLILSQWSHGYEKFVSYGVLYDYIGLDVNTKQEEWYYNRLIKDSLDELKSIQFINDYDIVTSQGVRFIFNKLKLEKAKFKDRYLTTNDIIDRLTSIGFTVADLTKYLRLDNEAYVSALLRYIDDKVNQGHTIKDLKRYVEQGLKYENYDVRDYMI